LKKPFQGPFEKQRRTLYNSQWAPLKRGSGESAEGQSRKKGVRGLVLGWGGGSKNRDSSAILSRDKIHWSSRENALQGSNTTI